MDLYKDMRRKTRLVGNFHNIMLYGHHRFKGELIGRMTKKVRVYILETRRGDVVCPVEGRGVCAERGGGYPRPDERNPDMGDCP